MDIIPQNSILEFKVDTLQYVRALYDLEKPGRMDDAIDIIIEWLKKQDHLPRKDFSRGYIERIIIFSKGSVERAKVKLDKTCTLKTLLPNYFESFDVMNCEILNSIKCFIVPKMTDDHYRVFVMKNVGQRFESGFFDIYRYFIMICEYLQAHDYCNGIVGVLDYYEANLTEVIKSTNLVELRQAMSIIMEGYGMRIKAIHFLTTSNVIDTFVTIFKQTINPKVAQRIHIHKKLDTLYDHIQKDLLPLDYGGKEKAINNYCDDLKHELCSEGFTKYFDEMRQASSNEALRSQEKFNEQYMGMPGSFRKLNVD